MNELITNWFHTGISCYFPLLTAHLQWLGFDLQEIGIVNLIASVGAAFGLLLAAAWTPRCGHRSNLAVAVLLVAFCGAGLVLVPRLNGRPHGRPETERPVAEILCRPEGSALFFRKCGDSCELDAVTRTELSVSDCRFEPQSRLPVNFLDWINRFALTNANSGGKTGDEDDLSEPERGDLPQKIPPVPTQSSGDRDEGEQFQPTDVETEDLGPINQSGSPSGIAPYDYDYEENHRQDVVEEEEQVVRTKRRRKRQSVPIMDVQPPRQFDPIDEFEIAEKADLPYTSSPHICFSSYSSSTTTCNFSAPVVQLLTFCCIDLFFRSPLQVTSLRAPTICFGSIRPSIPASHIMASASTRSITTTSTIKFCRNCDADPTSPIIRYKNNIIAGPAMF